MQSQSSDWHATHLYQFVSYIVRQTIADMDRTAVHCIHFRCKIWRVTCTDSLTQIPANSTHTEHLADKICAGRIYSYTMCAVYTSYNYNTLLASIWLKNSGKPFVDTNNIVDVCSKTHAKSVPDVKHKSRVLRKMTGRIAPGIPKKIMKHLPCCLNKKDPTPQDRHICYLLPNCEINLWTYAANMCKNDVDFCCQN